MLCILRCSHSGPGNRFPKTLKVSFVFYSKFFFYLFHKNQNEVNFRNYTCFELSPTWLFHLLRLSYKAKQGTILYVNAMDKKTYI